MGEIRKSIEESRDRIRRRLQLEGCDDEIEFPPVPSDCDDDELAGAAGPVPARGIPQSRDQIRRRLQLEGCDEEIEFPPLPSDCDDDDDEPAGAAGPVPARGIPQKYEGVQEVTDDMQRLCFQNVETEQDVIDRTTPHVGTVEVIEDTPGPKMRGLMRDVTSEHHKRPLRFNRKTLLISMPEEKWTRDESGFPVWNPGTPYYEEGELLPPRHYTPSPELAYDTGHSQPDRRTQWRLLQDRNRQRMEECISSRESREAVEARLPYDRGQPRSERQMQRRELQETDQQRMEECVTSREMREDVEERFGDISSDESDIPCLPPRYWKMKLNEPMDMDEVSRCEREDPTFNTWYQR